MPSHPKGKHRKKIVAKKTARELDADIAAVLQSSSIPSPEEDARLDDLNAYNDALMEHIGGDDLDRVLGGLARRGIKTDAELRASARESVHPDDLAAALARDGHSLGRYGIEGIGRR